MAKKIDDYFLSKFWCRNICTTSHLKFVFVSIQIRGLFFSRKIFFFSEIDLAIGDGENVNVNESDSNERACV